MPSNNGGTKLCVCARVCVCVADWLTGYLARVMRCHLFSRFIANFPIRFFPTSLQTHTHLNTCKHIQIHLRLHSLGKSRNKEIQRRFYLLHFHSFAARIAHITHCELKECEMKCKTTQRIACDCAAPHFSHPPALIQAHSCSLCPHTR